MPAPLDPEKRALIEQDIRDGLTRNEIARKHGVSGATVTKIGKKVEATGGLPAFDRSQTKQATAAAQTDLAARRADLAVRLMNRAFELEKRLDEERIVGWTGRGEDREPIREKPGGRDSQGFMVAIGIAVDKIGVLTAAEGTDAASTLIGGIFETLRAKYQTSVPDAGD